jgi:predicted AAA+ superfamily ATPase
VLHELVCRRDYEKNEPISYWRSTSGFEVDFIVGDHTAIEVKAKTSVGDRDLKGLRALGEERLMKRLLCASLEPRPRRVGEILILPVAELWSALGG